MDIKSGLRYLSIFILIGFGLLTLCLSGSILLDLFDIRVKEGNYVLFVVWSNFICSFLYLISAYGFLKVQGWTKALLSIAIIVLIISFMFLQMHIGSGGIYETKTVNAMIFRISLTSVLAVIAYFTISNKKEK